YPLSPPIIFRQASSAVDRIVPLVHSLLTASQQSQVIPFTLQNTALQPCSYWKYDTLHVIVECGSAFFEDISKGMQILVNYPILLTYMVVILM
ncbi:unnamed protein product, partial [Porites evermanni]